MYEKIYLAGLGVYNRSEKLGKEGFKLFEELADEGVDIQDRISKNVDHLKQKSKDIFFRNVNTISRLLTFNAKNDDVEVLSRQIDELTNAVSALVLASAQDEQKMTTKANPHRK
ncbi:MAG: phasin family protein [Endozoicomonas sp. (ex Botrylloides leachii)]|nr:phasin family protein [Endozoicomonas sp. (ex Botrylloides leachii)]